MHVFLKLVILRRKGEKREGIQILKKAHRTFDPRNTLCPVHCSLTQFQRGDGLGDIAFYFSQNVVMSEEHYFYTELSLLAEIGGYLGLLLGVSLFNLADWTAGLLQEKINKRR